MREYFLLAFRTLLKRKQRTFLTIVGILIGVVMVISLISLGRGMQVAVRNAFEGIGYNRVFVFAGQSKNLLESKMSSELLTEKDLSVVEKTPGIQVAKGVNLEGLLVECCGTKKLVPVWGVPVDKEGLTLIRKFSFFAISKGREFKIKDKGVAIIGSKVVDDFDGKIDVGKILLINGKRFKVIGIQKRSGSPIHDGLIRIRLSEFEALTGSKNFPAIFALTVEGEDVSNIAERVERRLEKIRTEESFNVQTAEQLAKRIQRMLDIIQIVLVGIAFVSVLVSITGTITTMYTSVYERIRDIGVMKAIGATNKAIFFIFLIESGIIGLLAGLFGLFFGWAFASIVSKFISAYLMIEVNPIFSPYVVMLGLAISFLVGCSAGVFPALHASKLDPVEVMRR